MLRDFGGLLQALIIITGIILYPISEYGFHRKVTKWLYLASTKHDDYFLKCNSKKNPMAKWNKHELIPPSYDHQMKQEVKNHRVM